jgi:hypothetical protein
MSDKEERVQDIWSLIESDLKDPENGILAAKNTDKFTLFVGEKVR